MITFADKASVLNLERRKSNGNPRSAGFFPNRKGCFQKTVEAPVVMISAQGQTPLGIGKICYADQDPLEDGTDAELIRQNVWRKDQVGWLWAFVNGMNYMLAKVSPMGAESLMKGYITENGQIVLKTTK
jgi:hypothetical protein